MAEERSVSDVLQDILRNLQDMVRSEIRLAKVEIREEVRRVVSSSVWIAAGRTRVIAGAGVHNGVLQIIGTKGNDRITLRLKPGDKAVYVKNAKYKPRSDAPSALAGGKIVAVGHMTQNIDEPRAFVRGDRSLGRCRRASGQEGSQNDCLIHSRSFPESG